MPRRQYFLLITSGIVSLAALLAGLYFGGAFHKPLPNLNSATLYPSNFREIADFALTDQNGQTTTLNDLEGHWSLLFFGYTYCPDICPTTLYLMTQVKALLNTSDAQEPIQYVFISVDPQRDKPQRLKEYVEYFDTAFVGLSGKKVEIDKLVSSLGVYYRRQEAEDNENYLVDHSAGLFLLNPDGKPQALFSAPHDATKLAHDITLITEYFGNSDA